MDNFDLIEVFGTLEDNNISEKILDKDDVDYLHEIELVQLPISVNVVFTSVRASSAIVQPLSWKDISSFVSSLNVRNDGA